MARRSINRVLSFLNALSVQIRENPWLTFLAVD
jgi:hypothetical protein